MPFIPEHNVWATHRENRILQLTFLSARRDAI